MKLGNRTRAEVEARLEPKAERHSGQSWTESLAGRTQEILHSVDKKLGAVGRAAHEDLNQD